MEINLDEQLAIAKKQLDSGNYGQAAQAATKLIDSKQDKYVKEGLIYKGLSLSYQEKDAEAVDYFTQVINQYSDYKLAYFDRCQSLIRLSKFKEARADAVAYRDLDLSNPEHYNLLITVDEFLGDFAKVVETCDQALALQPNHFDYLFSRAAAKLALKKYQAAIDDYEKASQTDGLDDIDMSMIYSDMGFAHLELGQFAKAKHYLTEADEIDSNNPYILNNLGFTLAHLNEHQKGLDLLNLAIEIDHLNCYAYKNRAKIHLMLQQKEAAKTDLLKAQQLKYDLLYGNEVNDLLRQL